MRKQDETTDDKGRVYEEQCTGSSSHGNHGRYGSEPEPEQQEERQVAHPRTPTPGSDDNIQCELQHKLRNGRKHRARAPRSTDLALCAYAESPPRESRSVAHIFAVAPVGDQATLVE